MLSCHLCLLISCDSLVFRSLSLDCFFYLIAWYLYSLLIYNDENDYGCWIIIFKSRSTLVVK